MRTLEVQRFTLLHCFNAAQKFGLWSNGCGVGKDADKPRRKKWRSSQSLTRLERKGINQEHGIRLS